MVETRDFSCNFVVRGPIENNKRYLTVVVAGEKMSDILLSPNPTDARRQQPVRHVRNRSSTPLKRRITRPSPKCGGDFRFSTYLPS